MRRVPQGLECSSRLRFVPTGRLAGRDPKWFSVAIAVLFGLLLPAFAAAQSTDSLGTPAPPPASNLPPFGVNSGRDGIWYTVPIPSSTPAAPSRALESSPPALDSDVLGARDEHSMIFDPAGNRFIVFGGITQTSGPDHNDVWERPAASTNDGWVLMSPQGTPPSPRYGHTAIYDPVRRRMVVFGGHSIATTDYLWELTLDDPPTWAPIVATGTGPAERYGHSAVYDATHDQMIVFGGRTPSLSNETWALQFATNPPTWQKLSPTGSLPGGRLEHVAILDQPRNRMVIYGGTGNQRYADVWTLSLGATPAWTLAIFASSIGSLTGAVAAFDGAADRMVVFSGYTSTSYPTELFALDLATMTWTTPATSPQPGSRWLAAFAFDPATRRGILHGGVVSTSPSLGDTWELTMSPSPAWTHLPPSPPAAPTLSSPPDGATGVPLPATLSWSASSGATSYRVQVSTSAAFLSTVYDQNDIVSTLVNVGGLAYSTGYYWRVSAANVGGSGPYSTVFGFTTAPPPPPPEAPTLSSPADGATGVAVPVALIWNASSGATSYRLQISTDASFATVVFDQSNIGGSSASVSGLAASTMYHWRVSATNISGTSPYSTAFGFTTGVPPPPPSVLGTRYAAAGVFDPVRGRYLMMGGASGTNPVVYRKDVAELVLGRDSSWVSTSVGGSMFSPRYGHSAIYDPLRDRVIVFGGYGGSYLGDLWQIQLSPIVTGSLLTAAGTPPTPRDFHSAIYDPVRDRMILFGGNDGAPHGDVWELTLSGTPTWTRIDVAGSGPSARLSHRAIYDPLGDRMIVFGGYDSRSLNDLWALTLSGTPAWSQLQPSGSLPGVRHSHSLIYDPNRNRAILYGGLVQETGSVYSDTWELTLAGGTPAWRSFIGAISNPGTRYAQLALDDPVNDRMLISGGYRQTPTAGVLGDAWRLQWYDDATATTTALLSVDARPDGVTLRWNVRGDAGTPARIERQRSEEAWAMVDRVVLDGSQQVSFDDRDVRPGERLAYRLVVEEPSGATMSATTWVTVPAGATLELFGFEPNPALERARVAFSLPGSGPAKLELLDVTGRRVAHQAIAGGAAGRRVVELTPDAALAPGLYFIRLQQGGRTLLRRGTVVR